MEKLLVPVITMKDIVTLTEEEFRNVVIEKFEQGYKLPFAAYYLLPDELKKVYLEELWMTGEYPYMDETDSYSKQIFKDAVRLIRDIVREDLVSFFGDYLLETNEPYTPNKGWKTILKPLNIDYNCPI